MKIPPSKSPASAADSPYRRSYYIIVHYKQKNPFLLRHTDPNCCILKQYKCYHVKHLIKTLSIK